jgi:hypothetical protein
MFKQFELYSNVGEFLMTKMSLLVMQYVAIAQTARMMHPINTLPNTFCPVLCSTTPLVGFSAAPAGGYNPVHPPQ